MWLLLFCLTSVLAQRGPGRDRSDKPSSRPDTTSIEERYARFQGNRERCFTSDNFKFPTLPEWAAEFARRAIDSLPKICVNIQFEFCTEKPQLELNITLDGELYRNVMISDDQQYCAQPEEEDTQAECIPCVGIKEGTLKIKSNFAQACPEYRLVCNFGGYKQTIRPETNDQMPCLSFGDNCTAPTKKECLAQRGCGWCNGNGEGMEYEDDNSPEGTGCTPMVPIGRPEPGKRPDFQPFCANCPAENFISYEPKGAEKTVDYVETHPGQIVGITLGSAVFILALVGCFVFSIRSKSQRPNSDLYDGSLADNDSLGNTGIQMQPAYDDQ